MSPVTRTSLFCAAAVDAQIAALVLFLNQEVGVDMPVDCPSKSYIYILASKSWVQLQRIGGEFKIRHLNPF